MKQTANHFNTFFAKVGKETFKKSQQYLHNSPEALHSVHTDSQVAINPIYLFRPKPTDWQTITLTIAHMKKQ